MILPFPHKALWPNGRFHYGTKAREFKKHKGWAFNAALSALPRSFKHDGSPVRLRYIITPKTRNKIDRDNAVAAMKAYQDGIAAAMKVDDSLFTVPEIEFSEPKKPGGVEVVL